MGCSCCDGAKSSRKFEDVLGDAEAKEAEGVEEFGSSSTKKAGLMFEM